MIIKNAEFVKSLASVNDFYDTGMPEILVVGRSNVGKSSFINFIANNGKLARTSSAPGRTRLINLFLFNKSFLFVDLPGFGFASVSKEEKRKWGILIENYIAFSKNIVNVFHLVDIRHEPSSDDLTMVNYLHQSGIPFTIIATKCDKLSRMQLLKSKRRLASALKIGEDNVICVSSVSRAGKEDVLDRIEQVLSADDDVYLETD